ncbi:MAG TPA: extracellular solute-binding protein [Bryobacteraceae bacterium]|nr:extracellular solute-binding protein [Bryobacteraceae bacterium]
MARPAAGVVIVAAICAFFSSCSDRLGAASRGEFSVRTLATGSSDFAFERRVFENFGRRQGLHVQTYQAFSTINEHLEEDLESLREKSPDPDIYEIDVIWPGILAGYLVDLRQWLSADEIAAFAPELIRSFTVGGKLIALPFTYDRALLYYRSDLLRKYGFHGPPRTWDELDSMAGVIQRGERKAGNRDFWGYVWQGSASEALVCNALEWQVSEGGGQIIEPDGRINVCSPAGIRSLERAASWVGRISPPGVVAYTEEDCVNVWLAGNAAFMRNWVYPYGAIRSPSSAIHDKVEVTQLPAGEYRRATTNGTMGIGVSLYSRNIPRAVAALRELTNESTQRDRAVQLGQIPTRTSLLRDASVMSATPLYELTGNHGWELADSIDRPSTAAGPRYAQISKAYSSAVQSVLMRQTSAASAMQRLQSELGRIPGLQGRAR